MTNYNNENQNLVPETAPKLSLSLDEIIPDMGRLYRLPEFHVPEVLTPAVIMSLVGEGKLVPSTTNVMNVVNKPSLNSWSNWMVASELVDYVKANPDNVNYLRSNARKAINYFKFSADRYRDKAAARGSRVHYAIDLINKNIPIDGLILSDEENAMVRQYRNWLEKFSPEILYSEITGFGKTSRNQLGYANTTDIIVNLRGKNTMIDIKCTTDETLVLLPDGSQKQAKDMQVGDKVVAWDADKGLHVSEILTAESNGYQPVFTITTSSGHSVTTTNNHPYWVMKANGQEDWVKAEDLRLGDVLSQAIGWDRSPEREDVEWPFSHNLSPYVFGVLWALKNFSNTTIESTETLLPLPKIAKEGLKEELHQIGFRFTKDNELKLDNGLPKLARKNEVSEDDIIEIMNTTILPDYLFNAPQISKQGFIAGVSEVFSNKSVYKNELYVVLKNEEATRSFQQFLINYGVTATFAKNQSSGLTYVRSGFLNSETVYNYGLEGTKIVSILPHEEPEHTIALEVAGAHSHVTGGIVTHNTNRKGLKGGTAHQIAANANNHILHTDDGVTVDMPQIDEGFGLHLSPTKATFQRLDIGEKTLAEFENMRELWDSNVFNHKQLRSSGLLLDEVESPENF